MKMIIKKKLTTKNGSAFMEMRFHNLLEIN